jgi:hypothetical protein
MTFGIPGRRRLATALVTAAAMSVAAAAAVIPAGVASGAGPAPADPHDWDAFPGCASALRTGTMSFPGQVARQTHWVSATINPDGPSLFEFQPRISQPTSDRHFPDGVPASRPGRRTAPLCKA